MAFWLLYGGGCCRGVSSFRAATVGEWHFGCYTEVAVVEGFRVLERPLLGNGILAVIRRWLLERGDRYEGFHCTSIRELFPPSSKPLSTQWYND